MYDELVRRVRCQRFGNCPDCSMWYAEEIEPNLWRERCAAIDAADAIEEMNRRIDRAIELYNRNVEKSAMYEALAGISPEPPKKAEEGE